MNNIDIIIDTREQEISHILNYFKYNNINYFFKKLDYGDYSFVADYHDFSKQFVIERKANLDELARNFTTAKKNSPFYVNRRERFKREFQRAKENQAKIILLIENASLDDIRNHNYRSRFHPNSFLASLKSWKNKRKLIDEIYFGEKEFTAEFMLLIFEDYYTQLKKRGEYNVNKALRK